ncbi:MAG: gliding motility-associated C-terminal domain-containing protein [Flavobacteriales bacterium]
MMHLNLSKRLFAALVPALLAATAAWAQVPTQCLEIESILVDACIDLAQCPGGAEGQNEMVRFRTGPQPIALDELEADWPNNSWNGLVQNATTADLTTTLNATIQGCGWLLEPPGGIIPPGSAVLLVTSTQMCTAANSFANLSDTLFIVFQAPGNTSGHFANHTNGGTVSETPTGASSLRTLVLTYLPTGCADTATYDRALLVNNLGTYGGGSVLNDGATAEFSWPGDAVVTYVNYGCQAPFVPTLVEVVDADGSICNGTGSVQLVGSVSGTDVVSVLWQGGTGSFDDPTSITVTYTAGAGDVGPVVVQFCAIGSCGLPICIDYTLPSASSPLITITPDGPTALCPGQSVTLTASGGDNYVWSPGGETSPSITVSAPGGYSVDGTNACGTGSAQITITEASGPSISITPDGPTALCPGQSVTLTASGGDSYVWSPGGETSASITVSDPGGYSVDGSNACGTGSAQITITEASGPSIIITPDGPTAICPGQSVTLTASGGDSYVWSPGGETSASITVSDPGSYSVDGTNACGTGSAQITITQASGPSVQITPNGPTALCSGQSVVLTASGANNYIWSNQQSGASITVNQAGTFSVIGSNSCGNGTAQIEITVVNVSASFTASPAFGEAPLEVAFTNTSTPQSANMLWQFGDGFASTDFEPTHTYDEDGTYTVTLTVTAQGCVATASGIIVVGELDQVPSSVVVPNVFTPNGDGQNDQFRVDAVGIERMEVVIYNRYGAEVARLERARQAWDGRTFGGEPVSDGTYFFVLEATGFDGKSHSLKGTVMVLR